MASLLHAMKRAWLSLLARESPLSSAARAWLSENGESESADTRFQSWTDNQSQRFSVETHAAREVLRDNQAQMFSVETCHAIKCPTKIMSGGQNYGCRILSGQNMPAIICPPDIIWLPYFVLVCHILSGVYDMLLFRSCTISLLN